MDFHGKYSKHIVIKFINSLLQFVNAQFVATITQLIQTFFVYVKLNSVILQVVQSKLQVLKQLEVKDNVSSSSATFLRGEGRKSWILPSHLTQTKEIFTQKQPDHMVEDTYKDILL